jgi:dolichol-phosphate mannosyltransferase
MNSPPALSVIAPCYNEQAGLPQFLQRMDSACRQFANGAYEIILINDGSTDDTWPCIRALASRHAQGVDQAVGKIIGVNLSRNHGHQIAVSAGLGMARGQRILVIDADLQDPPELLGDMMALMNGGFDVVYGRRRARAGETWLKKKTASLFYQLLGRLSDVEIPADVGDFRLMSRQIVDRLNAMPEQDRFLRGMVAWLGGRQTEALYDRDPRIAGETGYSLSKMIRLAVAGITGFSTAPLRLSALMTGFGIVFGFAVAIYSIASKISGHVTPGWTSLALIVAIFSTAQMACLAILSIYVGRIFKQVKQRPLYLIDEVVRQDDLPADPAADPAEEKSPPLGEGSAA